MSGRPRPAAALAVPLALAATAAGCRTVDVEEASDVPTRESAAGRVFSHADYDAVLGRFVDAAGMVDYPALVADPEPLDRYVGALAAASPDSHPELFPSDAHAIAYWMNAYNALMLRAVKDAYPVRSVTEIMVAHGVFKRLKFPVGGEPMTLDDVEKGTLLVRYEDEPRIHFGLTCASMGCPRLERTAFRGEELDAQLDAAARRFLSSDRGVVPEPDAGVLRLSKYFDWYREDFPPDPRTYVLPFLEPERRARVEALGPDAKIRFLDYDWRLNDATAPWAATAP